MEQGTGLTGIMESSLSLVRELGRDMVEEMIRKAEESHLESKERSAEWVVQSKNREKTVSTLQGTSTIGGPTTGTGKAGPSGT